MSDGTTRNVAVKWSPKQIDTTTSGYKSITGTVVGTSKTVNYNVLVGDYIVQDIPNITIEKNKNEAFIMPLKVQATLSPMSGTEELLGEVEVLSWERNLDTLNPGTYTAQGISQRYLDEFGSYKQFTLTLIVSDTPTATIQSISTLFQSVLRGGTYNLPSHVVAYMSDGSQQSVPVSWNTNVVDTSVVGTRTITGTVSGYSNPVILELNIVDQKLIIENVIVQEGKSNGTLIVYGNAGATVVLKDGTGKIMKYGIVIPESGKVIITGVDTRSNKHGVDTVMLMMNNWGNSDVWKLNY